MRSIVLASAAVVLLALPLWTSEALADGEPVDLGDVVVTSTRRSLPLGQVADEVRVVSREEIEALSPSSTGQLLQLVLGSAVETGTGSGLPKRHIVGLNGLPAQYTLVLVDGVRLLSEHIHSGQNLEMIPPEAIERIEVLRGGASAQYGSDAVGGVVHIITRRASKERTNTSLGLRVGGYGEKAGQVSWLGPVAQGLRVSTFVHRELSDGVPLKAPAHRVGQMGYERLHLLTRVDADLGDTHAWAWLNWTDHQIEWREEDAFSELLTAAVGLRNSFGPALSWTTQLSTSEWEAEVSEEDNQLLQPETWLSWTLSPGHVLTGGLDLRQQTFTRSAVLEETQSTWGAFLQYEGLLLPWLTLNPALRFDSVLDVDWALSPRLALLFTPDQPLRVRATVSRSFRAPSPQELNEEGYGHGGRAYRFGNPELTPERAISGSLGLEVFPLEGLELGATLSRTGLQDMIVPVYGGAWEQDPSKDVWRRTNLSEITVWAAELRARYRPFPGLHIEGGYSLTDDEDDEGRRLPYHAGSTAFFELRGEARLSKSWRIASFIVLNAVFGRSAWSWKPAPGAAVDDSQGLEVSLEDYQKLNLGLALVHSAGYRFYLNGDNLLGQDLEHLDDVHTVIAGEPVFRGGLRCGW